jgi:hypothetical protein
MNMTNVKMLIKPCETLGDIIAEICDECNIGPDEHFAFSAIMVPDKDDATYNVLKVNCLIPIEENPYTPTVLIEKLYNSIDDKKHIQYVNPPFELWMELFKPFLTSLVCAMHQRYEKLIPDREEITSILYYTVAKLYKKGYYLHKSLIRKAFLNELNMECRKLKYVELESLDAPIGYDDDGKEITLLDQLVDPTDAEKADSEQRQELYEKIKARMLQDMSEFAFNRIMIQLKSGTIDRMTSYHLNKYREIFNPEYIPRPNAKGKRKERKQ